MIILESGARSTYNVKHFRCETTSQRPFFSQRNYFLVMASNEMSRREHVAQRPQRYVGKALNIVARRAASPEHNFSSPQLTLFLAAVIYLFLTLSPPYINPHLIRLLTWIRGARPAASPSPSP